MTSLTKLSLANRMLVGLVTVAIVVFGLLATASLRQELLPSTQIPTAVVTATYPGTSPETVSKDVAEPLEQAISSVKGVTSVRSVSANGFASLTVEWDYGLDDDETIAAIRTAADGVPDLPDDTEVTVQAGSTDDIPVLVLAVGSDAELRELNQLVSDVAVPQLSEVDGVRQVQLSGQDTTELAVTLKPAELRENDLTAAAVTQLVQAQALVVPAGTSYDGDDELAIEVGSAPGDAKSVGNWPIATADGPVPLKSLASVKVQSVDSTTVARQDGRPALSLTVLKESDADAVEISHAVEDLLPDLERTMGSATTFSTVFDQAPSIEQSIHDLAVEGGLGLAFAVLIILAFLFSVRSTVIAAISIPLSLLIAMIGLRAGEYSLNIFTLAALTVAVGRVVDDSIVVVENIKRRAVPGVALTPADIVASVREVAGAVTASTLTTVAVFLPVAIVSGVTGELFRPFSVTVAIALVASLLVSMTIVPVLAFWFLRSSKARPAGAAVESEDHVTRLQRGYLPVLNFALRRPLVVLLTAVLVFVGTMASATLLKTDFLGSVAEKSSVQISQELPAGTRLSATSEAAEKIEQMLAGMPDVSGYLTTVGQGGSNLATVTATVRDEDRWDAVKADLEARLAEMPDVGETTVASVNTTGAGSDVTVTVTGDDPELLASTAEQVQTTLGGIAGLDEVTSDLAEQRPILEVDVDRGTAAEQGFTQAEVGQAIAGALRGTQVGTVTLEGESRDIMVRTQANDASPRDIARIELPVSQLQQAKATEKATDRVTKKQEDAAEEAEAEAAEATEEQRQELVEQREETSEGLTEARQQLARLQASPPPPPALPSGPPQPAVPLPTELPPEVAKLLPSAAPDPDDPDEVADAVPEPEELDEAARAVREAVVAAGQAIAAGQAAQAAAVAQAQGVTAALAAQIAQQTYAQQLAQVSAAVTQSQAGLEQIDAQLTGLDEQVEQAEEQREQSEELADEQQAVADVRADPLTVGDLADVEQVLAPSTVTQIDGIRAVTVSATPSSSDLGELTQIVQTQLDRLDVPAGITVEQGGASSDQQEAFTQLGLAMLLAIVLVFLIMVATFRSLVQPLILLISIPFAATGAVAALLLTDTPLGVPAMIGLLMLIGIVVTNAIVLIDLVNQYRAKGEDVRTAVVDGARLRLRPIIMTAAATICALIPMGLGLTGGGAFISRPLAVVVIGGLVSSTILTLLLVPVLYTLVERRGERRQARRDAAAQAPAQEAPAEA